MKMTDPDKGEVTGFFIQLQNRIIEGLLGLDPEILISEDKWSRPGGGGGISKAIIQGNVFEKGGVNYSCVYGSAPDFLISENNKQNSAREEFLATGVSVVIHPGNPFVPIIHMNVRYLELSDGRKWFGGGIDLTPHYIIKEDAVFFHKELKKKCDGHDPEYYKKFKHEADEYFFIRHRNETRGVGGIFFDHLQPEDDKSLSDIFSFVKEIGETFIPVYSEIVNRNKNMIFNGTQKQWQNLRRSRYVEFNLVYDRGTKFGLETDGRTESILVSMPPVAEWIYNYTAEENSPEASTQAFLKKGIDWING